jgi:hypothetical protein
MPLFDLGSMVTLWTAAGPDFGRGRAENRHCETGLAGPIPPFQFP